MQGDTPTQAAARLRLTGSNRHHGRINVTRFSFCRQLHMQLQMKGSKESLPIFNPHKEK